MRPIAIALLGVSAFSLGVTAAVAQPAKTPSAKMSFFVTSRGLGDGANLGGLKGADAHCATLAAAAGSARRGWKAYLSIQATAAQRAVNARDRIGRGPWYNFDGERIARNVADLHSETNRLGKSISLTERGGVVNGAGDTPNRHDILTGSLANGEAPVGAENRTCGNWSSSGEGSALVGHHDRKGGGPAGSSWNSAHPSRACGQAALQATGGDGLFYCFAK